MALGRREARHETVASARLAVHAEDWHDFTPGQQVMTTDGFPGKVVAVHDGPWAGSEEYEVTLDNGMGGGTYTASLLSPMNTTTANVEVATAAADYPELAEILIERPPLAHSVQASRKTATDHAGDPTYTDAGTCPACHAKGRLLKSSTGLTKCENCGHEFQTKQASVEPAFDPYLMIATAAADPSFAFHITASFADVRNKAKRLRAEGGVNVIAVSDGTIAANVKGDHGVYETALVRQPGKQAIAQWMCGCKWAAYSWGRTGKYRRFEGRLCSHALALQYEASSRGMFGKTIEEDQKAPEWLRPRTRVVTEYDRDNRKNVSRPAQPRKRDLERTYADLHLGDESPVEVLVREALLSGDSPAEVVLLLRTAGIDARPMIRHAAEGGPLPEHGDQQPCARAICGHPEGVHGGEHTDCQAAGCKCPRYQGASAKRSVGHKAHHPPRHPHSHQHEYAIHPGPHHGYGAWWHGIGGGGLYGLCGACGGGGCGACGGTGVGLAGSGAADSGASMGGASGDAGGGGMGSTGTLVQAPSAPPVIWNATKPMSPTENPASTGWASTGDPQNWEGVTDNVGGRIGALDEAMFEPDMVHEALPLPKALPKPLPTAQDEAAAGAAKTEPHSDISRQQKAKDYLTDPENQQRQRQQQQQPTQPKPPGTNWLAEQTQQQIANEDRYNTATLDDEPEPALPHTDGADEDLDKHGSVEDIVAQFQATAGQALLSGGSQTDSDVLSVSAAAKEHLARTAMKTFSPTEQKAIIEEGVGTTASNLDRLVLEGTHYAELEQALAAAEDDDDLW